MWQENCEALYQRARPDPAASSAAPLFAHGHKCYGVRTRGRGAEVRRCIFSNYCEGLDQMHKQVTCQLWDRESLDEPGLLKSRDGRRRLVAPPWRPSDSGQ